MGVSTKTLSRIQKLHENGFLTSGGSIMELGAQQVMCRGKDKFVRDFIRYFSINNPDIKCADEYKSSEIRSVANNGLMGKLMDVCGFKYCALDIFDADNTILFDLNIHDVQVELFQQFDLVTNFGTTEHVIHQYRAMKTVHDLTKVGGIIYHDLPMSGYHCHGYFSYTPLQSYIKNQYPTDTPTFMNDNGYSDKGYYDCGIEFIFQKVADVPFQMPLETSTSLGLNKSLWGDQNPYIRDVSISTVEASNVDVSAHIETLGLKQIAAKGTSIPPLLETVTRWELQKELIKRYRKIILKLIRR
jgi:hypothetical protein